VAGDDREICRRWVREAGVAAIPLSAFYASGHKPGALVRLCFAKADAVLDQAAERLIQWRRGAS
jgi:aspartate/methionine/tyrosine aminotransferase